MKIGVLDDHPSLLGYLDSLLTLDGHHVSIYQSSISFLETLTPHHVEGTLPYDLVILDVVLPGPFSGLDVLRKLQKYSAHMCLPAILITAASEANIENMQEEIPDEVPILRKPFSSHTLRRLIIQCTASIRARTSHEPPHHSA